MIFLDIYNSPNEVNVKRLISYLNTILKGKVLSSKAIDCKIFKCSWKEEEINSIEVAHVLGAIRYLEFLLKNQDELFEYRVKQTISELCSFGLIRNCNNTAMNIGSSNIQSSWEHFKYAESVFFNKKLNSSISKDVSILYSIRLALESRLFGALGIDFVKYRKGVIIGHVKVSDVIEILKKMKTIDNIADCDFVNIKRVNTFLNEFIHRAMIPKPWIIYRLFEILNPIFTSSIVKGTSGMTISSNHYFVISDENSFRIEIKELLMNRLKTEDLYINWSPKKEYHKK